MKLFEKFVFYGLLVGVLTNILIFYHYYFGLRKFDCHNNESELPHHFLSKNCSSVLHEVEGLDIKVNDILMRKTKNNLIELQYAFEHGLEELHNNNASQKFNEVKSHLVMQLLAAVIEVEDMYLFNEEWRRKEANELTELIQTNIYFLQNPENCSNAKTLTCKVADNCGFGCQLHHFAYCFMIAYGLQRTLFFDFPLNFGNWEAFFLPLSGTCTKVSGPIIKWKGIGQSENAQNIYFNQYGNIDPGILPPFRPLGFPEDISQRLLRFHGNPSVWWVGQFIHYLLRPQPWLKEIYDNTMKKIGLNDTFAGIHVRRTDKIMLGEAGYHSIEEYMKPVNIWYDKLDLKLSRIKSSKKVTRIVYLASDDPSVLPEARKKFPNYVFYGDIHNPELASWKRNSKDGFVAFLIDVFVLSKSKFLSCTFSSNVCRLAYELMQHQHPDASDFFHSLDDIYYYVGHMGHDQRAVYPHRSGDGEISLEVGDLVDIAGNHWNGYSKGRNKRTGAIGLYPSYKVEEVYQLIKYPTYEEAKKEHSLL